MTIPREIPLSAEEVAERPPPEKWMEMWEEAKAKPVAPYESRALLGVYLPKRADG